MVTTHKSVFHKYFTMKEYEMTNLDWLRAVALRYLKGRGLPAQRRALLTLQDVVRVKGRPGGGLELEGRALPSELAPGPAGDE